MSCVGQDLRGPISESRGKIRKMNRRTVPLVAAAAGSSGLRRLIPSAHSPAVAFPSPDYSSLTKEQLVLRLQDLERSTAESERELLAAVKELRDVKAALDEHSIVAI